MLHVVPLAVFSKETSMTTSAIDELLLQVQKKEIELFEINLTDLARKFRSEQDISILYPGAKFIAGLAHLIYLKAQALVPAEEEKTEEEDFAELSLQKIEEYTHFKEVAKSFSLKEREQADCFWRPQAPPPAEEIPRPFFVPLDLEEFSRLFMQIWEQAKTRDICIYEEEWNVADALKIVRLQLIDHKRLSLPILFPLEYSKERLIVTFLAVLELLKNQEASLAKLDSEWYLLCH